MSHKTETGLDWDAIQRELELYDNPGTAKQADILRAAERLFAQNGYAETPTASIAKEAGVTEKTLFKHFPTKAQLFRRILIPILARTVFPVQIAHVGRLLKEHDQSWVELFTALATDRWRMLRAMRGKAKLALSELLMNDALRRQVEKIFVERAYPLMVERIRKMQAEGKLRADVPAEIIARLQIGVIGSQAIMRSLFRDAPPDDDEEYAKVLAGILFTGLAPRPVDGAG